MPDKRNKRLTIGLLLLLAAAAAGRIDSADVAFIEIPSNLYHPMTTNRGASVIIPHEGVAGFLQSVMDGSYAGGE